MHAFDAFDAFGAFSGRGGAGDDAAQPAGFEPVYCEAAGGGYEQLYARKADDSGWEPVFAFFFDALMTRTDDGSFEVFQVATGDGYETLMVS